MNKLKKFLISGLAVCTLGCTAAGIAACTPSDSYPPYRKPADYVEIGDSSNGEFNGNYTVTVMTAGGMRINDVKVDVKLNGETVLSAISMDNGEISFRLTPAEYEIVVDESTLPTGYFIGDDKFKTSATSGKASVIISSKVMASTAVSSYRYSLGDVMYDFSYTDNNGERHILSELLSEDSQYKAVFLNFWYIGCGPCRDEFPAIQAAYENYNDRIKFIAVSTSDTQSAINTFRNENRYTFDMVQDYSGLASLFSITSTPATVVIDRYGVYVDYEVGKEVDSRIWSSKFAHYISDNYVQNPTDTTQPGDGDSEETVQRVKPNIAEDDYTKFPSIINGEGAEGKVIEYFGAISENDKEYNWPWVSELGTLGRPHVKATNSTYGNSFSILTMTVSLLRGDYVSYDYYTSTETGNDILYVIINGEIAAQHSGESGDGLDPALNGWATNRAVFTASRNRTVEISFCYMKDQMEDGGDDYVAISNITVENVRNVTDAIDMKTDACSGEIDRTGTMYTEYATPYFNNKDNYYHVKYEGDKDSILYLDFLNATAWSDLHIGSTTFKPINYEVTQQASLYMLIYWDHTNWRTQGDDEGLRLTMGGADADRLTEEYITSYYTNLFSSNSLIPVTEGRKDLIETFLKEYCRIENITYHKDMWLEFCYYFMHFGGEHIYIDQELYEEEVPVVYDSANDVHRVDNGNDGIDSKVYINFIRTGSFGIENSSGIIDYYSLENAISENLFGDVNGVNYTAKISAYLSNSKNNNGELYGLVEADKELVDILKAFVSAYGFKDENDWKMFACYYNIDDCNATSDPVPGMNFINAYTAVEGNNVMNVWNSHTMDGGGMLAKFVPTQSGVYKFASFNSQAGDNPRFIIYDANHNEITHFDNLVRYDLFLSQNTDDFEGYVYLNKGETYYLRVYKGFQTEGKVNYSIECVGETYDELRVATTGDGMWSFDLNLGLNFAFYLAINVDLYNNYYYHIDSEGLRRSIVYIDFVHPNFYDIKDNSLYDMIDAGLFDFSEFGAPDYTAKMLEYYFKATSKDESDETYGMTEASKELVDILAMFIEIRNSERFETKYWLAFATYYEYHSAQQ